MATPSNKCLWIAFALAFAVVVAAAIQPSAAATSRVQPQEVDAAAAGQQGGSSSSSSRPPFSWRPRPLPPIPCIPGLPRLPWLPACSNDSSSPSPGGGAAPPPSPPQPAECRTSLSGLATPCAEFLTNRTSVAPPAAACCDGLKSLVKDAPVCLCDAMSGDLGKLLPAPLLRLRMMELPRTCRVAMPFGTLRKCIRGPVPPMDAPPSAAPPAA